MNGEKANTMRALVLTAAFVLAVALFPRIAAAVGTPSGTLINNQATVTYQDVSSNNFSAVSNTTTVTVLPVYAVTITAPADLSVPSNTSAYYAYLLTNTGNATNTFNFSGLSAPLGWAVTFYADDGAGGGIANDGIHQASETTVITGVNNLAADGTYRFFMAVAVPSGTANGTSTGTTLTVTGTGDAGGADDATDAVTTTAQAPALTVAKDVRNASVVPADTFNGDGLANATPTQRLEYQVTVTNGGPVAATSVVLVDPINANTGFVIGSASFNAGTSGLTGATIDYSSDGGVTWTCNPAANACGATPPAGVDWCCNRIRWTGTGTMAVGPSSFSTLFQVQVK